MTYLRDHQVAVVQRDCLDLDQTVVLAKFGQWVVFDKSQILEAWLVSVAGFDDPS